MQVESLARNIPREEMVRRIHEMKESGRMKAVLGNMTSHEMLDTFFFLTDRYTHAPPYTPCIQAHIHTNHTTKNIECFLVNLRLQ